MNIRIIAAAGLMLLPAVLKAEEGFRAFEAQGRAIEAKIVSSDLQRGTIELMLRNKQRKKVKSSIFCESDQNYIRDWNMVKEFNSQRFKVEPVKNTVETFRKDPQRGIRRDVERIRYDIKVSNRSSIEMTGLRLEYNIFYEQQELGRGSNVDKEYFLFGASKVDDIQARKNRVVLSKTFDIYNQRLAGGYSGYTDGTPTNQTGKSKGIWLKLHLKTPTGLIATREICLPKNVSEQFKWKTDS